jgi:aerobic carbon-monoxide dehydrogenase medium subunit
MFASQFAYHRADTIAEALRQLAAHPGAKLLAGGHSLLPLMKLRLAAPEALIDIGRVAELKGIAVAGDRIRIGALSTHAEIAGSEVVRSGCPILAEAAERIGDPAVRNRGTIGGSVAHADPGADLPTVLVVLGAEIEVAGAQGVRSIPAEAFFMGLMTTALGSDEILTDIVVPTLAHGTAAAYVKFPHPASRYAVIGAAALVSVRQGTVESARIAVGGLLPLPTRLVAVEAACAGQPADDSTAERAAAHTAAVLGDEVLGDIFASAEYRRAVAGTYVQRALSAAFTRAA